MIAWFLAAAGVALFLSSKTEGSILSTIKTVPALCKSEAWNRYDALFRKYASLNGINWHWLKAFACQESRLATDSRTKVGAVSGDGKSWGLMQITLPTALALGSGPIVGTALNDPELSIKLAAKLVAELNRTFPGDLHKMCISYNQGATNTRNGKDYTGPYWGGNGTSDPGWKFWLDTVESNP